MYPKDILSKGKGLLIQPNHTVNSVNLMEKLCLKKNLRKNLKIRDVLALDMYQKTWIQVSALLFDNAVWLTFCKSLSVSNFIFVRDNNSCTSIISLLEDQMKYLG